MIKNYPSVKITPDENSPQDCRVFVDDKEITNLIGYKVEKYPGSLPMVIIETEDNIEMNFDKSEVFFQYLPNCIDTAIKMLTRSGYKVFDRKGNEIKEEYE